MRIYRSVWLVLCVLLAAVGASVALVKSPAAVAFLFIYFGALGMLLTPGLVAEYWECSSGGRMRLFARGAVLGGSAGCAFIGFASLLGLGIFLLAVVILASSPYAVSRYRPWQGLARRSRCVETLGRACERVRPHYVSPPLDLTTLTDEQLCGLWRASYLALLHGSAGQVSAAVLEQQRYLDEFERRNRRGFATWLASGPLASANPLPYLVGVPTINWDDLTREQD